MGADGLRRPPVLLPAECLLVWRWGPARERGLPSATSGSPVRRASPGLRSHTTVRCGQECPRSFVMRWNIRADRNVCITLAMWACKGARTLLSAKCLLASSATNLGFHHPCNGFFWHCADCGTRRSGFFCLSNGWSGSCRGFGGHCDGWRRGRGDFFRLCGGWMRGGRGFLGVCCRVIWGTSRIRGAESRYTGPKSRRPWLQS